MRLLETTDGRTYRLTDRFHHQSQIPAYAILSHTWEDEQEVLFDDIVKDKKRKYRSLCSSLRLRPRSRRKGYEKLQFCARQAKQDGLRYFWVDTCCIDKSDPFELKRAINSMFQWYRNANKCYVYLSDVSVVSAKANLVASEWQVAFANSRWFTRGWTLQELLAPPAVEFFSKEGIYLGTRLELKQLIHEITSIPPRALSGAPLTEFAVDEKLSWAVERQTTLEEDEVYALLGIFDITLPFIYDEGYDKALRRLLDKISASQLDVDQNCEEGRILRSTMPFRRDKDFVSREALNAVQQLCSGPAACAALVGLGGVGKSQIAIEYANQILESSLDTWVFWVHADTRARLISSFHEIAEKINMNGWNDPKADIVQLVVAWMRTESNGSWLVVIDSADDASVFQDTVTSHVDHDTNTTTTTSVPLWPLLARSSRGSILLTSRNREVASLILGTESNTLEVGPMRTKGALALLQKKLTSIVKHEEAHALINALDHMPLALTQAAAFINRTPRMSVKRYLEGFENDKAQLLEQNVVDIRRHAEVSNSIMSTWQISFNYIRERSVTAARLLSLMSLFDRQKIPRALLERNYIEDEDEDRDFEHDMYMLTSFCLVKAGVDGSSYEMHGLVQFATKKWLQLNDELEYWRQMYILVISSTFSLELLEDEPRCQEFFPHIQTALDNHPLNADALEIWASIAHTAGCYLFDRGEFSQAYKLTSEALEVREILCDPDDPVIFDNLNSVGIALRWIGRYEEAKVMYERAIEGQTRVHGPGDFQTLTSALNLASLHDDNGHWVEAETLLLQILDAARQLDTEVGHGLVLSILSGLAINHKGFGRYKEAAALLLQVAEARERDLGPNHRTTTTIKSNLANAYTYLGRFREAEELNREVLRVHELYHHVETEILVTKGHIAYCLEAQGFWTEAETMKLEVLKRTEAKLGPEHPDTIFAVSHLASNYIDQGRFDEAETLRLQNIAVSKKIFGEDHSNTLDAEAGLAVIYGEQKRYGESEALLTRLLKIRQAELGDRHPTTLRLKANLASIYRDQGRYEEAQQKEEFVLQARTEHLGEEHMDTLLILGNLAVTLRRQGFVEKAYELKERSYQGHIKVLGPEHPITKRHREGLEKWRREDQEAEDKTRKHTCNQRSVDELKQMSIE